MECRGRRGSQEHCACGRRRHANRVSNSTEVGRLRLGWPWLHRHESPRMRADVRVRRATHRGCGHGHSLERKRRVRQEGFGSPSPTYKDDLNALIQHPRHWTHFDNSDASIAAISRIIYDALCGICAASGTHPPPIGQGHREVAEGKRRAPSATSAGGDTRLKR